MISHQTIDSRGLAYATAIVEHIEADPTRHAVEQAQKRCQRWMKQAPSPDLLVWSTLLSRPWQEIKNSLLDLSEQGNRLRQNNPFCGVLSPQERWTIHRAFRSHETHGYYAHGITDDTVVLAKGWQQRLVRLETPMTHGVVGLCLAPVDIAISKLAAAREKDLSFVKVMYENSLFDITELRKLIQTLPEQTRTYIEALLLGIIPAND